MKCEKQKQGFELCSQKNCMTYEIEMERVHMDGYGVSNLRGVGGARKQVKRDGNSIWDGGDCIQSGVILYSCRLIW